MDTLRETAELLHPALVVLSSTLAAQLAEAEPGLAELALAAPLALAGAGASASVAETIGARYLEQNPVEAAAAVARDVRPADVPTRVIGCERHAKGGETSCNLDVIECSERVCHSTEAVFFYSCAM